MVSGPVWEIVYEASRVDRKRRTRRQGMKTGEGISRISVSQMNFVLVTVIDSILAQFPHLALRRPSLSFLHPFYYHELPNLSQQKL